METSIPKSVLQVYEKLEENGFEVFIVGGSVRDLLLKRPIKDWDITTNATPEQITKIFTDSFYDNQFGTVGIPSEINSKSTVIEVTTYRSDGEYKDKRHPESVTWGRSIEEDLKRRDFTINAIAMKKNGELIDPFNGKDDLEKKIIKAVGDANLRFKEDALRLLRAIRIATELNFLIDEETKNKILEDYALIKNVSWERIKNELFRILASINAYDGIMLLHELKLLEIILPELIEGIGVSQKRPGRHHTEDVFTHNLLSLKFCPSNDPVVKFATLIHDAGKPRVEKKDEEGLVIFHNHEVVGAKMAIEICNRFKFSKKEKDKVVNLIRWHMFSVNENQTDSAIRRFIRKVGVENVKDMMDLRVGDRLGGGTQTAESWRLKLFKKKIEEQLKPAPFSINDLAIDGNDIIKILNSKPGPLIGTILQQLFEEVDNDLSKNNKEYLGQRIIELGNELKNKYN